MKTILLFFAICLPTFLIAQSTSDILESGIRVQNNEIRLKLQQSALKYKTITSRKTSYVSLDDSLFFLSEDKVPVYIITLNPLNFSVSSSIKYTVDELSKAEDDALKTIISTVKAGAASTPGPNDFNSIKLAIEKLQKSLLNNNKKKIADQFSLLKGINFENSTAASSIISNVKKIKDELVQEYLGYVESSVNIKNNIIAYSEPAPIPPATVKLHDESIAKWMFNQELERINATIVSQQKWLANLVVAIDLVENAMINSVTADDELVTQITEVDVVNGKIANLSVIISQDGYKLNNENEIVVDDKKVLSTKVLRFRRFKRFVFEFAAGVAFVNLSFPKYGTTTDELGQTIVTDAGEDVFKKFNLSAMFNWNYYIPKSPIHPFIQLGVGANSQYPVLFSGVGLRFNSSSKSHFAISFGATTSWIKKLDTLKIGDIVAGTADIEKDVKYEFQDCIKPYIGIQYNF